MNRDGEYSGRRRPVRSEHPYGGGQRFLPQGVSLDDGGADPHGGDGARDRIQRNHAAAGLRFALNETIKSLTGSVKNNKAIISSISAFINAIAKLKGNVKSK